VTAPLPSMITVAALNRLPGVRHAFFTREGGTSEGLFSSLNCSFSSGDDSANVQANRDLAVAQLDLPPDRLASVSQCHSNKVVVVEGDRPSPPIEADAMVTLRRGIALGVLSADCAPVLLADPVAGVIGAAHAGWRGALHGVLDNTVSAMLAIGASRARLVAAIGPSIGHASYDVGPEFAAPFLAEDPACALFFTPGDGGRPARFDLPGYIARRLARLSVASVICTPCDTYRQADRFFSHRRAQQRGEPVCGRMMSAIALEP